MDNATIERLMRERGWNWDRDSLDDPDGRFEKDSHLALTIDGARELLRSGGRHPKTSYAAARNVRPARAEGRVGPRARPRSAVSSRHRIPPRGSEATSDHAAAREAERGPFRHAIAAVGVTEARRKPVARHRRQGRSGPLAG